VLDELQVLGLRVDAEALWGDADGPLTFAGLALHAVDDPVDDHFAFELGEHAEHLYKHASGRRGGVEWLGGGTEDHTGVVEFVEQRDEVADAATEPVHPVDQQDVKPPGARSGERAFQAGPVQAGSRSVVGELRNDAPTVLGVGVGVELVVLGFDGEWLVLFVGGSSCVGGDPQMGRRDREDRLCKAGSAWHKASSEGGGRATGGFPAARLLRGLLFLVGRVGGGPLDPGDDHGGEQVYGLTVLFLGDRGDVRGGEPQRDRAGFVCCPRSRCRWWRARGRGTVA
jgi:hypothetical protein